jgi:hypothetical protein
MTKAAQLYHLYAKTWFGWLGFGLVVLASALEVAPELGVPVPVVGGIYWAGTTLAGTAFLQQAQSRFGKWMAGGGGIALAAAGQYLLQAFPGNRYAEVGGMLAMGVGGLWKGALSKRPDAEAARASMAPPPPDPDPDRTPAETPTAKRLSDRP